MPRERRLLPAPVIPAQAGIQVSRERRSWERSCPARIDRLWTRCSPSAGGTRAFPGRRSQECSREACLAENPTAHMPRDRLTVDNDTHRPSDSPRCGAPRWRGPCARPRFGARPPGLAPFRRADEWTTAFAPIGPTGESRQGRIPPGFRERGRRRGGSPRLVWGLVLRGGAAASARRTRRCGRRQSRGRGRPGGRGRITSPRIGDVLRRRRSSPERRMRRRLAALREPAPAA